VTTQRLVTLLGPGGHGKTRLAVELAHALAAAAPADAPAAPFDLVAFVPLVAARDADALLMALLLALRQDSRGADPLDHLAGLLAGRRSLLVLDNAEQLVDSCAGQVATLLARCPGLHLLVTSRRALGLDGEHLHLLAPLPLPGDPPGDVLPAADEGASLRALAANPAVALFVDRARAARAGFQLGAEQAGAVQALVVHLQGMPLAIELAAAQVRSIDPATLLGLLQTDGAQAAPEGPAAPGLAPGLRLLARSGPRAGADPRHASMLAVVQWSWGLLSPHAQALLPRLSVLAGSFSLGAAQALADAPASAVAQVLDELVGQSMLRSTDDGRRYALFELIREFAASRLEPAAAPGLRQRHRHWLTGWFAALPLSAPLQQVRAEVPNLAAAFCGADLDGADADAAALAAAAQTALSTISLPPQALAALQRCVERLPDPVAGAVARAGLARSLLVNGQTTAAGRLADAALAALPPAAAGAGLARAQVLARVAHVRWRLHRDPAAAGWLDEALALARSAGALALQATILTNQGAVLRPRQPQAAIVLQRQAIALWAQAGDRHGVNVGRCNLATALLARRAGCAEALALLQQAADDTRAAGDDLQHALACNLQGEAWSRLGRWAGAAAAYRACIAAAWTAAEPWPLAYGLWNLPRALAHLRQPQRAARLMGFAQAHVPTVTGPLTRADRHDLRRLQRLCRRQADADALERWWADGRVLRLPLAVGEALQP
jgi:predicted ATPase